MRAVLILVAGFVISSACSAAVRTGTPGATEILKLLGRADLIGDPAFVLEIKPWKALGRAYVALMYIDLDGVVAARRVRPMLSVVRDEGGKLTLLAHAEIEEPRCRDEETSRERDLGGDVCTGMYLDLATYRISSLETAVGLRTKIHSSFPAGESETEQLTLFRITGNRIKPIFSTDISLRDEQRGPGDLTTSESTLRISVHRTSGYFDLLVTSHTRFEKLLDSNRARIERVEHRFKWQGDSYGAAR